MSLDRGGSRCFGQAGSVILKRRAIVPRHPFERVAESCRAAKTPVRLRISCDHFEIAAVAWEERKLENAVIECAGHPVAETPAGK